MDIFSEEPACRGGVAWLNANRGRMVGPGRSQEIWAGDSLTLQVYGKYLEDENQKVNAGSFASQGAKDRLLNDLNEFAVSTQRAGGGNPIALFNLVDILAKDFQKKESPEAYLIYALYDQDSNRYEVGKKVLSKSAANQHEVLEENLYISQDGFVETFVVNETSEDVWFDNMMVMSMSSPIAQETHYDPWGLELTGIGFQYGGIKANKYLYNGKELIEDNGLQYYDYGARMYDPTIGRWGVVDPLAREFPWNSKYAFAENDVIRSIDLDGLEKLIVTKETSSFVNGVLKALNSDEILIKEVAGPISKKELRDKVHTYFVRNDIFPYISSSRSNAVTLRPKDVEKIVRDITEYDLGNRSKFSGPDIQRNKKFFVDAGLNFNSIKESIDSGIGVSIVVLNRSKSDEEQELTLLHEMYLHLKKLDNANAGEDHIDGFGSEAYSDGSSPIYSPEKVPADSKMGKIENRYKNAKKKID